MSDLVRREDVLDLVSMAREDWLDVPSVQSACGRLANRIGNIPAIGTCATCAEWGQRCIYDGVNIKKVLDDGVCRKWRNITPPDHFCAAYRRGDK